jgi:hypothetical protein
MLSIQEGLLSDKNKVKQKKVAFEEEEEDEVEK